MTMEATGGSGSFLLEILHWLWLPVLLGACVALLTTTPWRRGVARHTRILTIVAVVAVLSELGWRFLAPGSVVPLAAWAAALLVLSLALTAVDFRQTEENFGRHGEAGLEKMTVERPIEDDPFRPAHQSVAPPLARNTWGEIFVEQTADAIAVMDPEGQIEFVNPAWAKKHGYQSSEVLGHHFSLFHTPEQLESIRQRFEEVRVAGTWEGISEQRKKNGQTFNTQAHLSTLQSTEGEPIGLVAIVRPEGLPADDLPVDQTPVVAASDHEQELETLRVLVGSVAHEFNNLLTGIMGNASLISLKPDGGEEHQEIETAARRAADLSRLLQAYSGKTHAASTDPLILDDLLTQFAETTALIARGRATVHYDFREDRDSEEDQAPISVDPAQLRLLFRKLIENAVEAAEGPDGGITVRTGEVRLKREDLDSMLMGGRRMSGPYVFLEVSDNGPGLDEATKTRMFEPFFTTRPGRRGLGLPTVSSITRAHQGAIEVHGGPGQGTRIRVLFPTSRRRPTKATSTSVETNLPTAEANVLTKTGVPTETSVPTETNQGTILVVDNEQIILDLARNFLELHGYSVLTADEGEPALTLFRQHGRDIRATLLDLSMPIMNGDKVFDKIRQMDPQALVVLMTGHDAGDVRKDFKGRGLAGVVQKPFKPEQLVGTLRSVLGR